jgi:hypothetical protein
MDINSNIIPHAHESFYKMLGKVVIYKVDCPYYFYVSHNNDAVIVSVVLLIPSQLKTKDDSE